MSRQKRSKPSAPASITWRTAKGVTEPGAGDEGGRAYPVAITSLAGMALLAHGNTPTRGRYAPQLRGTVDYLSNARSPQALITGPSQDSGQPMHGHGFALMFLATVYGMETKESTRAQIREVVQKRREPDPRVAKAARAVGPTFLVAAMKGRSRSLRSKGFAPRTTLGSVFRGARSSRRALHRAL